MHISPMLLMILDGWGYSDQNTNNAIQMAKTPFWDKLWNEFPKTLLNSSGSAVGLPEGQIGNSEVGHLHISSGRIIPQALTRINNHVLNDSFNSIELFKTICKSKKKIHLMGLLSDGGVHAHVEHFQAFLKDAKQYAPEIYIHAFLDGRDTPPKSAETALESIVPFLFDKAHIATICGRYYAMDRDRNWDRTYQAYKALFGESDFHASDPITALHDAYSRNESDEFVKPTICTKQNFAIENDDIIVFLNFRSDRARQLTQVFVDKNFQHFDTSPIKLNNFVSMTEYDADYQCNVFFPPEKIYNTLGEVISKKGLKQLRIAETEKYAHVTYFFNGGTEQPYSLEDRILVPSQKVATYDLAPQMSAKEITEKLLENLKKYNFIVCNFANADMVGHTGDLQAAIKAIETLDGSLRNIFDKLQEVNGTMLITADHGNAEIMYNNSEQQQHTAHTSNPVPCIVTNKSAKLVKGSNASLIDIAPTILELMQIDKPDEMAGDKIFSL